MARGVWIEGGLLRPVTRQPPAREATTIAWRRLDAPGHDSATLSPADGSWLLEGAAAFVEAGTPCHLAYRVATDAGWRTQAASVHGWAGATRIDLDIRVTPDQQWLVNGAIAAAVAGCVDVDLAFTPATNLLPIRRLGLAVGASAPVIAAWLPFPDLELQPLDQVYTRSGEASYDYSSQDGTFRVTLVVNDAGLVTDYPGLWREEPE
jgi:hypothetical protein